jgi:hypothetical protein
MSMSSSDSPSAEAARTTAERSVRVHIVRAGLVVGIGLAVVYAWTTWALPVSGLLGALVVAAAVMLLTGE